MKQLFLIMIATLFSTSLALAQRNVTGTVKGEDGSPLIGATVTVKNSNPLVGASTDADGKFSIKVPNGYEVLTISYIGYDPQEMTLSASNVVDVTLMEGNILKNVEITALGLKVDKDKSGNSSGTVAGNLLKKSGETGVLQGLAGKTSGLTIGRSTGDPGAGAYIQIRGQNTITGNTQPLIIIDGIPVNNNTVQTEVEQAQNSNLAGVAEQSRLNDINPNDIESIEVLKGAAAAALWGSRAANGVIIVTTKKGKAREGKKFSVDFSSSYSVDQINRKHPLQSTYGQGNYGAYAGSDRGGASTGNTWGDKIVDRSGGADIVVDAPNQYFYKDAQGNLIDQYVGYFVANDGSVYHNVMRTGRTYDQNGNLLPISNYVSGGNNSRATYLDENFDKVFRTGHFWDNSLSIGSADEKGSFYLSLGNLTQQGIIRNSSDYKRNTVRMNADRRLGDKLKASFNASYSNVKSNRIQQGSNTAGLYLGLLRNSPDFELNDEIGTFYDADGIGVPNSQRAYRNYVGSGIPAYNNPLWTINQQKNTSTVNRFISGGELTYEPLAWLAFTARAGVDNYTDNRVTYFPKNSAGGWGSGYYIDYTIWETQFNTDLFGRATHKFSDNFSANAVLGFNYNDRRYKDSYSSILGFIVPDAPPALNNSPASGRYMENLREVVLSNAGYATVGFDIYDQLFLNMTGRLERTSTSNGLFFYPSASMAWQFSKLLSANNTFSMGKLRASYGVVGVSAPAYISRTNYVPASFTGGWGDGIDANLYGTSFVSSFRKGTPGIEPEITKEFEIGTDLRFFSNRLSLGFTYYNRKTNGAIFTVDMPGSTGYQEAWANAGTLSNKGVEVDFSFDILKKDNFSWNVFGSFTKNTNKVESLNGVKSLILNGFEGTSSRAVEGYALGEIWGASFATDASGKMILDDDGFPTASETEGPIGNPNPKWRGGLGTGFSYKGFNLSMLFETAQGQKMWGGTRGVLTHFGVHEDTDNEVTLTDAEAADIMCYGGSSVLDTWGDGIEDADGTVTFRGKLQDFGGGNVALDQDWYQTLGGGFGPVSSQFIYDASWTRLRELTLSYRLDSKGFQEASKLGSIEVGVSGRNLFLWSPFQGVDPDTNLTGPTNGRGLDYFTNPGTRSIVFSLKVSY